MLSFRQIKIIPVFIVSLILINTKAFAETQSSKFWTDLNLQGNLFKVPNLEYVLDIQPRFSIDPDQFQQGVVRTGVGYQFQDNLQFWAGYQWNSIDQLSDENQQNRLWQQVSWKIFSETAWTLSSDSRLEERYLVGQAGCNDRYRQKFSIKFSNAVFSHYTPVISDEIFINITKPEWVGNNTFDQNRAFAGIGIPVTQASYLEVGYLNQYLLRAPENEMNHILYVGLYANAE